MLTDSTSHPVRLRAPSLMQLLLASVLLVLMAPLEADARFWPNRDWPNRNHKLKVCLDDPKNRCPANMADSIKGEFNDSGPGIPDIEKAMEPGYSTAPDKVRELGFGAGLGLCNIKKCSDDMDLKSEVGVGTNLKFKMVIENESKRDS